MPAGAKQRRRASFIWTPHQKIDHDLTFRQMLRDGPSRREDGTNRWFLFRRVFSLSERPVSAALSMTADGRYQLFVNGKHVGRGPVRSNPHFLRYDTHDIADRLHAGTNVFAVLVHAYGLDTAWYETVKGYWQPFFGDGGLYCDGRILGPDGESVEILSDENWRVTECTAWCRETPRAGWGQDFIEDFDANRMPDDWKSATFDDSAWDRSQVLEIVRDGDDRAKGWGRTVPFPCLEASDLAPLAETPVEPVNIMAQYGVVPEPGHSLDRRLYAEKFVDLPAGVVENADALLHDDDQTTTIRTSPTHDVALMIEFDKIRAGYPFIELEASGGEIIELAVSETYDGEFNDTGSARPRLKRAGHLDCAHMFRYTARSGFQRFEKFDWTAVRYMLLVVRNAPEGLRIRHAGSVHTHYPLEYAGSYDCSDDLLTRLWRVGVYTAQECTHDGWEDCPGREKRQWIGDGIVHYLVGAAAFGASSQPVDRKFFYDGAHSQRPDGLMEMFAPGDHHTNGMIIPDFSLHWVCGLYEYFLHTGDVKTAEELLPVAQRALAWFERQMGPHDLLADLPFWHFIEWANVGREGEAAIINAMFAGALKAAAKMAGWLGYQPLEKRYRGLAGRVAAALNNRHWDSARGVYVDMVDPVTGRQAMQVSQHANTATILWDIAPPDRWASMIRYITDPARTKLTSVPPIVISHQPFDRATDVVQANTYFGHFVYSALAKAGRFDLVLNKIRTSYRPMLETGAETLWESFEPTASLCHAFSASPVYQLSAHSLGVQPLTPGFETFRLAPQTADLDHAKGVYPTPEGGISVEWQRSEKGLKLAVTVPNGTQGHLEVPPGYRLAESRTTLKPGKHHLMLPSG